MIFFLQNTLAYSADLSETKRESFMRVVLTEKGSAKMIDWVLKKIFPSEWLKINGAMTITITTLSKMTFSISTLSVEG